MAYEVLGGQQEKEKVKDKEKMRSVELLEQSFSLGSSLLRRPVGSSKSPGNNHPATNKPPANRARCFEELSNLIPPYGERIFENWRERYRRKDVKRINRLRQRMKLTSTCLNLNTH